MLCILKKLETCVTPGSDAFSKMSSIYRRGKHTTYNFCSLQRCVLLCPLTHTPIQDFSGYASLRNRFLSAGTHYQIIKEPVRITSIVLIDSIDLATCTLIG